MSDLILNVDVIYEIINQLKDDNFALFNFLLVNKHFGEIAVSLLWKNPFQFCKINDNGKNYLIIQTYITCFNKKERIKATSILKNLNSYQTPFFKYGEYLKEFKIHEIKISISAWYNTFIKNAIISDSKYTRFETCLIRSLMRQCQTLDCIDLDISLADKYLLDTMQCKIMNLKNLTLYCKSYYNVVTTERVRRTLEIFKNHCQGLSCLIFDHFNINYKDVITKELKSLNSLTKVILNNVDFEKISFDFIEKCINLEILGLRSSKGLNLENIDPYTTFKNLKLLDLSYNEWSSEVNILIIKKAGDNLTSLTIGKEHNINTINDDTLIALIKYCPKINSLSFSKISKESINMVFSYLKEFKLVTLQIHQIEENSTVIKSKDLLDYIEYQNSLSKLGIGKNDNYWHYYNKSRDNFEKLLKKHNIRLIGYKPNDLKNRRILK
ncbi:hypothetical protein C1645_827508 [Glomus cerebriforme]|uniref:F-box domain-containing protein n=1 Tax=Glomus cerebriforme TaxID=658196 RepID=A0A397SY07_9GLOM|nr:hypothetical protein C1645_827508 [Glomus cerebriforme]